MQHYHTNAKLTKFQREAIQLTVNPNFSKMAKEFGVSRQTIAKWYKRKYTTDKSSKPNKIHYAMSPEQKDIVRSIHSKTKCTIEKLHAFTSGIGLNASQSSIYRCVRENIKSVKQKPKPKQFKKYEPGFIHIDVSYLPKMDKTKNYLFVAIDRATRSMFYCIYLKIKGQRPQLIFLINV